MLCASIMTGSMTLYLKNISNKIYNDVTIKHKHILSNILI